MFRLWHCLLWLGWLTSCQPGGPAPTRITVEYYLTTIPDPKTLGEAYVSDPDSVLPPGATPASTAAAGRTLMWC